MSLFDKLFSRGPKHPDPVHDPCGGDIGLRRVVEGLKQGAWKDADELLARTRKGDDRAARTGHIVGAANGWPAWIDEWHKARKDRPESWLIRGGIRIAWAWEVPGSGRADDIADEAWPVFFERIQEAEADLLEATRQGWLAPWQALNALSEKGSGSHEIMFALAREISANEPKGSQLHALIAEAHLHRWQYFSMEDPPDPKGQGRYYDQDDVQRELGRAWERGSDSPLFKPGRFANSPLISVGVFRLGRIVKQKPAPTQLTFSLATSRPPGLALLRDKIEEVAHH